MSQVHFPPVIPEMCRLRCGQPCGSAAHRRILQRRQQPRACRRTCPAGRQGGSGAAGLCPCAGNGRCAGVPLGGEPLRIHALPVGASYLQSRRGVHAWRTCTVWAPGLPLCAMAKPVRCGSFAAPLYGENAADASIFTLNLAAGRGALLHCFCAVPEDWQTLELTYAPGLSPPGRSVTFTVQPRRGPKRNWAWCPPPLPRWAAWWICKPNKLQKLPVASLHEELFVLSGLQQVVPGGILHGDFLTGQAGKPCNVAASAAGCSAACRRHHKRQRWSRCPASM